MNGQDLVVAIEEQGQIELAAMKAKQALIARLQKLVAARYPVGATMVGHYRGKDCYFILARTHAMPLKGSSVTVDLNGPIIRKDGTRGTDFAHAYHDITLAELACMEEREEVQA